MNSRKKKGIKAFLYYPISPFGIIDLISIVPSFSIGEASVRPLRIFRLARSLRVVRAFKLFRFSKSVTLLGKTFKTQRHILTLIAALTFMYILITSLILFNIEPDTFPTYIEALYWATMSLTTSTFGNIFPKSILGQLISMVSLLVGVLVVALPVSVMTAGYMEELSKSREETEKNEAKTFEKDKKDDTKQSNVYLKDHVYIEDFLDKLVGRQGDDSSEDEEDDTVDELTAEEKEYESYLKEIMKEILEEKEKEETKHLREEITENGDSEEKL